VLRFGNIYLCVFAIAGLIALAAHALFPDLATWHQVATNTLLVASLVLYPLLAFTPGIPKSAFVPLIAFVLWVSAGALPVTYYFAARDARLILATSQVALAALAFVIIRRRTGTTWLLTTEAVAPPTFSFRFGHTLKFVVASMLIIPLVASTYLALWGVISLERFTGGFIHVAPDGLYSEARQYVRDDKTVHLVGMFHLGDRTYYEEVVASFPRENAVVLVEGVTENAGLLPFGWPEQSQPLPAGLVLQKDMPLSAGQPVVRADVDTGELSDETLTFLSAASAILAAKDLGEALATYVQWTGTLDYHALHTAIDELILVRNERLLSQLRTALG
jgi:hypothetical protein